MAKFNIGDIITRDIKAPCGTVFKKGTETSMPTDEIRHLD